MNLQEFLKEFNACDTGNVWSMEEKTALFYYQCEVYGTDYIKKEDIDFDYCIKNKENVDY